MSRTKEEILKIKEVSADELDRQMLQDLKMVVSYLKGIRDNWQCKRGEHEWDSWSARLCGNVSENDSMGDDSFSYRACKNCGVEMPESRVYHKKGIKEKNALSYEDFPPNPKPKE